MAIGAFDQEVFGVHGPMTVGRAVQPDLLHPVVCDRCGCRLTRDASGAWIHFSGGLGADALGHRVECVELPHELAHGMQA